MRILVFSDSHGLVQPMLDAVEIYNPNAIFHLGDVVRDGEEVKRTFPRVPFYQVRGNCDEGVADCEEESVIQLEGKTIFYLHGHTQKAELGLGPAVAEAKVLGADLMLYGHTHRAQKDDYDGLLAVNPGAIKDGSCALLYWENGGPIQCLPLHL